MQRYNSAKFGQNNHSEEILHPFVISQILYRKADFSVVRG